MADVTLLNEGMHAPGNIYSFTKSELRLCSLWQIALQKSEFSLAFFIFVSETYLAGLGFGFLKETLYTIFCISIFVIVIFSLSSLVDVG